MNHDFKYDFTTILDRRGKDALALYAPSKTFNLAGLIGSYHIVYNSWIRERLEKEASLTHYNEMNVLSMYAVSGAPNRRARICCLQTAPNGVKNTTPRSTNSNARCGMSESLCRMDAFSAVTAMYA